MTQFDPTIFGYQDFFSTTLSADITAATLTIGLVTVPTPSSGILVINPSSTTAREIIFYNSKGASNITCPSDGRGFGGTSAVANLTGTTVIMADVAEFFAGLAAGTLSTDPLRTAAFVDFVVSGGVVAQSTGLVGTFSNIVFYHSGQRYAGSSIANRTYTASKDTYVDITGNSGGTVTVTYTEVANGAASPALTTNYLRIAKVVTGVSAITSVVQTGVDSVTTSGQLNFIYNTSATSAPIFIVANSGSAGGNIYYRNQNGLKEAWGITGNFSTGTTSSSVSVVWPAGFFGAAVQMASATSYNQTTVGQQYAQIGVVSTTSLTLTVYATTGATSAATFYARGF